MLVRDGAIARQEGQSRQTLAACPDSPERGDEWRWSVTRVDEGDGWSVHVDADDVHVAVDHTVLREPGELELVRRSGEELVVVARRGSHLVQDAAGPWRRWLHPGDVFVVEGEEPEHLVLTASQRSEASVVRLTPRGAQALRWVP
jgi:hypothetical protein